MSGPGYVYRVTAVLPDGADAEAWEPEGWHQWCWDNGRANAAACCADEWSEPGVCHTPFSWPSRRHFFSRTAAERCADRYEQWGATAYVTRSDPVSFTGDERAGPWLDGCRWAGNGIAAWIEAMIDQEEPMHRGLVRDGLITQAAPYGGMLAAYRATLSRVRELVEGPRD